jgi:hypothetical protein
VKESDSINCGQSNYHDKIYWTDLANEIIIAHVCSAALRVLPLGVLN